MAKITAPSGDIIFVDNDVAQSIGSFHVETSSCGIKTVRCYRGGKKVILARLIMKPPRNMVIDHINGDRLDNRRSNLRVCLQEENLKNRKRNKNNKTGYKGVALVRNGAWSARITADGKRVRLGVFDCPKKAHAAYKLAAMVLHRDYANFG